MSEFNSITLKELIQQAKSAGDLPMVGGCSYGDHSDTTQALPITGINFAHVCRSDYSDTRWAITRKSDLEESTQKVITLNEFDGDIDSALTGKELFEEITQFVSNNSDDVLELQVTFGSDYGDRASTMQANILEELNSGECSLVQSPYSTSGMAILSDENEDDFESSEKESFYTVS